MALKTRQLDFSPLDSRSRLYEERLRREGILANVVTDLAGYVTQAQAEKAKSRRQKQSDIAEGMAFDTNLTADTIINSSIARYWGKIRDSWVQEMQSRKGPVSAIDKAKLDIQKKSVMKMAQAGKNFVKVQDRMKQLGTGGSKDLYEYDWDEIQRTLQDLDSGVISLEDFSMTDFSKDYDSGMPFVNLRAIDPGQLENVGMKKFKDNTKKVGTETTIEDIVGGKKVTRVSQPITYGNYEEFADDMIAGINGRKGDNANIMKHISEDLTDQEKKIATEKYPEDNIEGSLLKYYYHDKRRPELEGQLEPTGKTKYKSVKAPKGGGITFLFGGKKATEEGQVSAQATKVEGVPFDQYIEFAKAAPKIKMVKGVTVKGASLLSGGETEAPEDKTTPMDYEVIGYDKGEDVVLLRNKVLTKGGVTHYETYKAPREGNEHFMKDLVSDETMQELREGKTGKKVEGATAEDPLGLGI